MKRWMTKAALAALVPAALLAEEPYWQAVEISYSPVKSNPEVLNAKLHYFTEDNDDRPYGYDVEDLISDKNPLSILYMGGEKIGFQFGGGVELRGSDSWMVLFRGRYVFDADWAGFRPVLGVSLGKGHDDRLDHDVVSRTAPPTLIRSGADFWGGDVAATLRRYFDGGLYVDAGYRFDWHQYSLDVATSNVAGTILLGQTSESEFKTVEHELVLRVGYSF